MKNLLLITLMLFGFLEAQTSVSGTFRPLGQYKFAFIYKSTPNGANFVDRARLDESGSFSINLDSSLEPGIYKVVYAIPPEENNFDFIYDAKENVNFDFNAETGIVFSESNENKLLASYMKSMGMINQTISNYYKKDGKDEKAFQEIFKTLVETQKAYESSASGMLALDLIQANHPYIPKSYEDVSTYSNNLKRSYFEHIDFDNEFLQSSSFIKDRINGFLFQVASKSSNADYKSRVDDIAKAIANSKAETRLDIYQLLWEEFIQLNNDELTTYIAKTYLLEAANASNNSKLVDKIVAQQRISIGSRAPNFDVVNKDVKTDLHNLPKDKQYLLIFWSSGCSHCLEELPKVHTILANKKDIKIIAYGLEDSAAQWESSIKAFPDFIHIFGTKKWDNPIVAKYSLSATPTYFLLDKDKTILAKPYDYKALEGIFIVQ
ncbi:MAG: thioredoxin family protein [Bacteroidota bacterium]